jgi:hypothetical protein
MNEGGDCSSNVVVFGICYGGAMLVRAVTVVAVTVCYGGFGGELVEVLRIFFAFDLFDGEREK